MDALLSHADTHLAVQILDFLTAEHADNEAQIKAAQSELLKQTDRFADVIKHETSATAKNTEVKQQEFNKKLEELREKCATLLSVLKESKFGVDRTENLATVTKQVPTVNDMMTQMLDLARMLYSSGKYQDSAQLLNKLDLIVTTSQQQTEMIWGRLASNVMARQWDSALTDIYRLSDRLEQSQLSPPKIKPQQLHLLVWSLCVYFNSQKSRDALMEVYMQSSNQSLFQNACPQLLPYLIAAYFMCNKQRRWTRDVAQLAKLDEQQRESNPLVAVVYHLQCTMDYEAAGEAITKIEKMCKYDYLFSAISDDLMFNVRLAVFDSVCRVYSRISLAALGVMLGAGGADAGKLVPALLNNSKVTAKVVDGHLVVQVAAKPVYQDILDKARELAVKSQQTLQKIV